MLKFTLKKRKKKMRVTYCHDIHRANRIKIFYILEFASFCKKKKKKTEKDTR